MSTKCPENSLYKTIFKPSIYKGFSSLIKTRYYVNGNCDIKTTTI